MLFVAIIVSQLILANLCFGLTNLSEDYRIHPCRRICRRGDVKVCEYTLNVEFLLTLEPSCDRCLGLSSDCPPECIIADGRRREIIGYNRQMPGPAIHVCQNDLIKAQVCNLLVDTSTTVHWHGIHQKDTPYMDGVPMITQCGIEPSTCFTYEFKASQAGTHWYHSHMDGQRADGLFGALIVHTNADNEYKNEDQDDHVMVINDWFNTTGHTQLLEDERMRTGFPNVIFSILIGGIGTNDTNGIPPRKYFVEQNKQYRFRVIHAGATSCPMHLWIENHTLTVIASDGNRIKPVTVDSLQLSNGERYDFILNASQIINQYVIKVQGTIHCNGRIGYAVLAYKGAPNNALNYTQFGPPSTGLQLNCVNEYDNSLCYNYMHLESREPMDYRLLGTPKKLYYFGVDVTKFVRRLVAGVGQEGTFSTVINNIVMTIPSAPLLLNPNVWQPFCNVENMNPAYCHDGGCECVHMIEIMLGDLVEFCFIDEGTIVDISHPMHLHGFTFVVVAYGKIGENVTVQHVKALDEQGKIRRRIKNSIFKDTVTIPDGGYTCVRFIADNPGFWLQHCHVDFHVAMGMQMAVKVGNYSTDNLPDKFPNCGNYVPKKRPSSWWWH